MRKDRDLRQSLRLFEDLIRFGFGVPLARLIQPSSSFFELMVVRQNLLEGFNDSLPRRRYKQRSDCSMFETQLPCNVKRGSAARCENGRNNKFLFHCDMAKDPLSEFSVCFHFNVAGINRSLFEQCFQSAMILFEEAIQIHHSCFTLDVGFSLSSTKDPESAVPSPQET